MEVNRTMLELVNQLDGFDRGGNVKVLMATNRLDTLDPALTRPGRIDRKVEFGALDLIGRVKVFRVHARLMAIERDARLSSWRDFADRGQPGRTSRGLSRGGHVRHPPRRRR